MRTLMKRALLVTVTAVAAVALSTAASASSITVELSTGGNTATFAVATAASQTLIANVYANFSAAGGGQIVVVTSMAATPGLTPVACREQNTQTIGSGPTNATWGRLTGNCGAGSPGDGGISGQDVLLMEQELKAGAASTSGTIRIGGVTFHMTGAAGTFYLNATFDGGLLDGIVGADGTTRAPTSLGGITVNVIPEPATVALLATGMLGLLGFSRRRKR